MPYRDKKKQQDYQRRWNAARRKDILGLTGRVCVDCGVDTPDIHLDHVDPRTKVDHRFATWSEPRRLAELAKTQPRCPSCHAKKGIIGGELMTGAVLDTEDVVAVRIMADRGMPAAALADAFNVTPATIKSAIAHRSWKYVTTEGSDVAQRAAEIFGA